MFSRYILLFFMFPILTNQQMPPKPPVIPLVDDLPFIKCDVCKKASKVIFKAVKNRRNEIAPVKLSEDDVLDIVERSCNPDDNDYGEWISKMDIVESSNGLTLQEHLKVGKCREECKTIQRSCEETIGDIDTDIGEILWKNNLKLTNFINNVCHSLTSSCTTTVNKYKRGKRKDFKFIEMTEKDIEAAKLMKNMKGMPGMPGLEMYTPEDLESMRDQLGIDNSQASVNSENEDLTEGNSYSENIAESSSLGFLDTVKAIGLDVVKKVKRLFGYGSKSEL